MLFTLFTLIESTEWNFSGLFQRDQWSRESTSKVSNAGSAPLVALVSSSTLVPGNKESEAIEMILN